MSGRRRSWATFICRSTWRRREAGEEGNGDRISGNRGRSLIREYRRLGDGSTAPAGAGMVVWIGSGGSAMLHHRLISLEPPAQGGQVVALRCTTSWFFLIVQPRRIFLIQVGNRAEKLNHLFPTSDLGTRGSVHGSAETAACLRPHPFRTVLRDGSISKQFFSFPHCSRINS